MFFFDHEIVQVLLLRKFIAETQTVVEQAETDDYKSVIGRLVQCDRQFIIMVTDFFFFSPYRLPCFIVGRCPDILYLETVIKVCLDVQFVYVFFISPFEVGFGVCVFFF